MAQRETSCPTHTNAGAGSLNVEAHDCGSTSSPADQAFAFDASTGHLTHTASSLCVTVDKCGTADCSNVVLAACGGSDSASCNGSNQKWAAVTPTKPAPEGGMWYQPANAPAECMEIPLGGPNVDIYNCTPDYPTPILHQIWRFPSGASSGTLTSASGLCLTAVNATTPSLPPVWPFPHSISTDTSGATSTVSSVFKFTGDALSSSPRLAAAAIRYEEFIQADTLSSDASAAAATATATATIMSCAVSVGSTDPTLDMSTNYTYSLSVSGSSCSVSAPTIYGAMYGFETLTQLVVNGSVPATVSVEDGPQFSHRGFMIDTGRRFVPLDTIKRMLDGMAFNKMNVLHLHASDFCRFSVQSAKFPELTANLTGVYGGFYSQADIADMVDYAGARGIRVMPEFDMPGHSGGMRPLRQAGLEMCSDGDYAIQMYDDPKNVTVAVLEALITEMAGVFPEQLMHLGCDETSVTGPCTLDNIADLERQMVTKVDDLKKIPVGWEELLFNTDAVSPDTIVNAWTRHYASEVTAKGFRAIESHGGYFYLNHPIPPSASWVDIAANIPADQMHLMLGGEVSMWTDNYCTITQCHDPGSHPVASALFPPEADASFQRSVLGMIFPRAYVGAAAFWNFNSDISAESTSFVNAYNFHANRLAARGVDSCPVTCNCNELTRCGTPYPLPSQ